MSESLVKDPELRHLGEFRIQTTALFLLYSALTGGHVVAAYFRGLAVKEVREKSLQKTLISSLLIFATIMLSDLGHALGNLLLLFWVQYHYFRQHFGVSRMLTPKALLSQSKLRWLDLAFTATIYFIPMLAFAPISSLNPNAIVFFFGRSYLDFLIKPFTNFFDLLMILSLSLFPLFLLLWLIYFVLLAADYRKNKENGPKLLFSIFLAASFIIGWAFLDPVASVASNVILHSVQYYYIVGWDQARGETKVPPLVKAFLPVIVCTGIGYFFTFVPATLYYTHPNEIFLRVLSGIAVGANIAHFYMDGYIWKRESPPRVALPS